MNLAFAAAGDDGKPKLPGSLHLNRRLDAWLSFKADGSVTIHPGKVELGQGILTAFTQIAAEELDVAPERIRIAPTVTGASPNEAVTSGSMSIQEGGMALRHACADARALFLSVAAQASGVPLEALRVEDGRFLGPAGEVGSYAALADRDLLGTEASPDAHPKPPGARRVVGQSFPRVDLPAKIFGEARFVQDLRLPGMQHARLIRPPAIGARLLEAPPGTIRDGDFLAVIAPTEAEADRLAARGEREARWSAGTGLPDLGTWLETATGAESVQLERGEDAPVARRIRRRFRRAYVAHASVGTCCAVALWDGAVMHVWSHSQGPYNLRADLAKALRLAPESIVVQHVEGSGCYGHNGADDVALDAALCARQRPGTPIRVLWNRAQELTSAPHSPAMIVDIEAGLDAAGGLAEWRVHVRSNGHSSRPGRQAVPTLHAGALIEGGQPVPPSINPPLAGGGGAQRNMIPLYRVPRLKATMTQFTDMPVRTSALRGLGALVNVLAIESVMEELAEMAGKDPLDFRLRHCDDPRAAHVLREAAAMSGWADRARLPEGEGLGLAMARYKNAGAWSAVVARVVTGERVRCTSLHIACDMGEIINPDGAMNQVEGGALHGVSHALHEAATFGPDRVTSDSWERYPVLRFRDVPRVQVKLIDRPEQPPLGVGETTMAPTMAAIASAIHQALGIWPRRLPFTPENLAESE
ncbi:molybdopterin cofactor-binding domain-containing protein [Roseococcus sp. YIM B11640]|uniref:xanthine dehydrogenase family protein molybdopterin-binding subunit n=1 Tax=Roseococcus sp. YIM B11640 TaxID=3133973 RepID=UPI003C7B6B58